MKKFLKATSNDSQKNLRRITHILERQFGSHLWSFSKSYLTAIFCTIVQFNQNSIT